MLLLVEQKRIRFSLSGRNVDRPVRLWIGGLPDLPGEVNGNQKVRSHSRAEVTNWGVREVRKVGACCSREWVNHLQKFRLVKSQCVFESILKNEHPGYCGSGGWTSSHALKIAGSIPSQEIHPWIAGSIPSTGCAGGWFTFHSHIDVFLCFFISL